LGSTTPDYVNCPATACLVQERLGAKHAGAFDLSAACSSCIYSLEAAAGMLSVNSSRKRALVIGAETLSRMINWEDRNTCALFGDGAGALLLEKTDAPSSGPDRRGLLRTILGADGSGAETLIVRKGGSKNHFKPGDTVDESVYLEMEGRGVYNFAVGAITATIKNLLDAEGLKMDDITMVIPHQANARIITAAQKRLGAPAEKFYINIERYANTSAASIPIALDELNRGGKLHRGDILLCVGFGAGLTYGGNLIIW
jgi:3-oxoacyl-[acyl-carrier-protein] synthase-3